MKKRMVISCCVCILLIGLFAFPGYPQEKGKLDDLIQTAKEAGEKIKKQGEFLVKEGEELLAKADKKSRTLGRALKKEGENLIA